ncbi:protein translocase subunit SecD [Thermoproteota archaeon]
MKTGYKLKITIALLALLSTVAILFKLPINLGLDLQGGTQVTLEAKDTPKQKVTNDAVLGSLAVIRNRVDSLGVTEPVIRRKGTRQIIVELPGIKDPQRAINIIGDTALLEFVEAEWAPGDTSKLSKEKLKILAGDEARIAIFQDRDAAGNITRELPILLKKTVLTGADLKIVNPGTGQNGQPVVNIEFKSEAAKKFHEVTRRAVGKPLAIILDGTIISAPNVSEPIAGGRAIISGSFTIEEMRDLVIKLKAGALPVPVEIISKKVIGPTLGRDSIEKGKKAGLIGFVLVCLFMIIFYQFPGLMACFALVFFILMSLASLKLIHATLTLPGIAGFILTIGMAVDANVLIFERIKEEKRFGQPLEAAISNGFSRAFRTIFDANVTTLIAATILFWLGTGSIRGFAVTLSIGIIVSMFSAVYITRLLIDAISHFGTKQEHIFFKA